MSQPEKIYLINSLSELGNKLVNPDDQLLELIESEHRYNAWFTPLNTANAVKAIGRMLNREDLEQWLDENQEPRVKSRESRGMKEDVNSEIEHPNFRNPAIYLLGTKEYLFLTKFGNPY